ncbi:Uncharacterised protein [Legionella wadsworthii]|uniref:Uncharacterized protein n=1 Tax=Legionella wadsworthii TaxID=28088 RepID=A0A378LPG6_9GAMM|nr:hypothetical protein [Legionella wadsworthii]STY28654.1 Uncharacterised protein [Legionella wadsworthii]
MDISFLVGFFTGCFSTALIGGRVKEFIQHRKKLENITHKKIMDLEKLFHEYPDLMNSIKKDISNPHSKNIREFLVVEKDAILNSLVPRFRYELSPDILPALNKLEDLGYIEKIKNNCLHYKIKEDFIRQLLSTPKGSIDSLCPGGAV